ncbi:MAG: thiol protease/hemagglutinin PrtT [Muribaculaceae bacterium]
MKKFLLLVIAAACALQVSAEQIGVTEAQNKAYQFVRKASRLKSFTGTDVQLVYMESAENGDNSFYVFNTGGNGFVIVSADSNSEEVLGYSDNGTFDPANIPPAMEEMFEQYKSEISYAATLDIEPSATATPTRKAIAPLCATKWNQSSPYNNLCPMYSTTQRCVTGCTATAMAQVMKYYEHPEKGTGSYSYTTSINNTSTTLSLDFSETTFDWDNMLNVYTSSATEAQNTAVATLMYNCGVACNMSYGLSSGASHVYACRAYSSYFGYDKSVQRAYRKFYSIQGWNDLVYNELANRRVVHYAGYNSGAGHSFVCDGYDTDEYFHINWGWGGTSDGYFKLSALTPSSQGIGGSNSGYNANQEIIYNIKADEGGSYAYEVVYGGEFKTTTTSVAKSNTGTVSFNFTNFSVLSANPNNVYFVMGVYAENTSTQQRTFIECSNIKQSVSCGMSYAYPASANNVQKINVSNLAALGEGTYKLYPAYKLTDLGLEGIAKVPYGVADYCDMTIDATNITFTKPTVAQPKLELTDLTFDSKFYVGNNYAVIASITCTGGEYCDLVYPVVVSEDLMTYYTGDGLIFSILEGETVTQRIIAQLPSDVTAGSYYFMLRDANNKQIGKSYEITVEEVGAGFSISASVPEFDDINNIDSNNIVITTTVTCSEGYFSGSIYAGWFYKTDTGYSNFQITPSDILFIDALSSKEVTIKESFGDIDLSKEYLVAIYYLNNNTGSFSQISSAASFKIATGIDDIAVDVDFNIFTSPAGDVVNVTSPDNIKRIDVFSLTGQQVANRMIADGAGAATVDVSHLTPGIYVVKVITAGGTHVERIVKK